MQCSSKKVKAKNFLKIRLSWAIFPLKCGAVALIRLKKRRGGAVAQEFKRWRTSRWHELKKVACAQHWREVKQVRMVKRGEGIRLRS